MPLFSFLLGLALTAGLAPSAGATDRTLVIDLSPFTPFAVGGDVWSDVFGASTIEGEVINAHLDVSFVSNDPGDWSMAITFHGFPQGGLIGVSSLTEGWSGIGTFDKVAETEALNGALVIPPGAAFWTWFMSWVGGVEFTPPGGVPRDITFWFQHWIPDVAGPAGFAASNGLSGTTP